MSEVEVETCLADVTAVVRRPKPAGDTSVSLSPPRGRSTSKNATGGSNSAAAGAAAASPAAARSLRRGEHAFSHPEWDRPWRSPAQQEAADTIALKEIEAEKQAQNCTVLRRQLRLAEAELKKTAAERAADLDFLDQERREEGRAKDRLVEQLREEGSRVEMALRRQMVALQKKKEEEARQADERYAALERTMAKQVEAHSKDLVEQADRHTKEVESMMKVIESKERELVEAETRHKKETEVALDARDSSSAGLLKQLHDVDGNWRQALDQQQERSNELRRADLVRIASLESSLLEEKERHAEAAKKATLLERRRLSDDSSQQLWATKLTSHVDTMINSFQAAPPSVTVDAKDKPSDPLSERLWTRLQQLWELVKEEHASHRAATHGLSDGRKQAKDAERAERERWDERRRELLALEYSVDDVRQKQDRLGHAFTELRTLAERMEQAERHLGDRLSFFIDDAEAAAELRLQPSAPPAPRAGLLSVVCVSAVGTPFWADKLMFRSSMEIFSSTVRAAAHKRGGYETVSRGDSFLFLFIDNTDACAFALDVQLSLYSAKWPEALLSLHEMKPDNLWRGLKAKVAVHYGDVKLVNMGTLQERRYGGTAMAYAAAVLAKTAPGQTVTSGRVWEEVQHRTDELPRCEIHSLGMHAVTSTAHPSGAEADKLVQLLPLPLAARSFPPVAQAEAEATGHQELLADALRRETDAFHQEGEGLRRGMEAVTRELEEVGKAAVVSTGRLRSLQVVRPYKQEDLVGAFATLDELMLHHDSSRRALEDLSVAQEAVSKGQQGLENAVAAHAQGLMTELEHRRELHALRQAHQEELISLQAQCKAEAQRLLAGVIKGRPGAALGAGSVSALNVSSAAFEDGAAAAAGPFDRSSLFNRTRRTPQAHPVAPSASSAAAGGGGGARRASVAGGAGGGGSKRGGVATWRRRGTSPVGAPLALHTPPQQQHGAGGGSAAGESPELARLSKEDSFLGKLSLS